MQAVLKGEKPKEKVLAKGGNVYCDASRENRK